jgi:hypothetical protein
MLFSMNSDERLPGEMLLLSIVEVPSELGLCFTGHIPHIVGTE